MNPTVVGNCEVRGGSSIFSLTSGEGMGQFQQNFTREEAGKLYRYLTDYLRETATDRIILLMGGPKHGDFYVLAKNEARFNRVSFACLDKPVWLKPDQPASPSMEFTNHVYTKAKDIFYDPTTGPVLPFDIYEHSSLCDLNVERKAARLDDAIRRASEKRKTADEAARKAKVQADRLTDEREAAYNAESDLLIQRQQLQFEFGV